MLKLNLPDFEYDIIKKEDKLYIKDVVRRKYVILSPEEWVRQHYINYLVGHKQVPKKLISVEGGLQYNRLQKRSDIVVYSRKMKAVLLVECKAPSVKLDDDVLSQALLYNAEIGARFIVLTNGITHIHQRNSGQALISLPDLPDYDALIEE